MNITLLDAQSLGQQPDLSSFESLGDFKAYNDTSVDELNERIANSQVIILNKLSIDRNTIQNNKQLELICVSATGLDNIDLEAAKENNVTVKNVKGYATESVAQVTWGMLLQLVNRTHYFDEYVKSGEYIKSPIFSHFGKVFQGLHTLRLGIIGLGDIGSRVAQIADFFGMEVVFHSPSGKREHKDYQKLSLEELLATSDVVSVHTPLTSETENLIGKEQFNLTKPDAIILNTARGGIINEHDLVEALDTNKIASAGIDVFTEEPILADSPYLKIKNPNKIILSPHIAWASKQARKTLIEEVANNIKSFVESKT